MADRMTSSQQTVEAVVGEAIGSVPFETERLVVGVGNEVYKLCFEDNSPVSNLILRIHHSEHPEFGYEKWAFEELTKHGVPVPKVLKIGTYESQGKHLSYSLETLIPGISLDEILTNGLTEGMRLDYAIQAGKTLARIHNVKTSGHGHLRDQGIGKYSTLVASMQQHEDYEDLMNALNDTELTVQNLDEAVALIDCVHTEEEPHLVHVDYAPKHIIIDDHTISGVIDFETCLSGYAATDFNRWRAQESRITMQELLVGYERIRKLPPDFWNLMYVVQVHSALRTILYHYRTTKDAVEIQKAAAEAKELIETKRVLLL